MYLDFVNKPIIILIFSIMPTLTDSHIMTPMAVETRYGYVIALCSFLLQAISGGISFSVGGYYIEFLETFGESKGLTAWIGSLNSGLLFGGGMLS